MDRAAPPAYARGMTDQIDHERGIWEIRVQPYDVITFLDHAHPGKRLIGSVGDVHSSMSTAGRVTMYEVTDADRKNWYINNFHEPQRATEELATEFLNQRRERDIARAKASKET